jgi:acetyl esterase/lipase
MKFLLLLVSITLFSFFSFAQEIVPLYDGLPPHAIATHVQDSTTMRGTMVWMTRIIKPKLTIYLPKKGNTGMGVVICPGGGYGGLAVKHEGHDIAKKLQENGIAGFVLEYRMPNTPYVDTKYKEFVPLIDAQRAILLVRENASKWGVKKNKVGILGNSAGGHLASTAGTHFNEEKIPNPYHTDLRPSFMVLNYPVISFADSITHNGSRNNLIGVKGVPLELEKIQKYSNELQVSLNTPPTFLIHAMDDTVVPVENSLLFMAALQQHKVPVELFLYSHGGHGFGLDNAQKETDWFNSCLKWLKQLKFK